MATIVDDARSELLRAMSVLMKRRADTTDQVEKQVITKTLEELNAEVDALDRAELLQAAMAVARASDSVEAAIGAAKLRPFDDFLRTIGDSLKQLGQIGGDMHARESLPSAEENTVPELARVVENPMPAAAARPTAADTTTRIRPTVIAKTNFDDVAAECDELYSICKINEERLDNVSFYVSRLLKFKRTYESVAEDLNGIPWQFIGITHAMEAGFDFSRHLHNGDPLTQRTVHVPKGHPLTGTPPFKWRESAVDALMLKGLHQIQGWTRARLLYELERFNGFGYRLRGVRTPYLWSFTNVYSKGKYIRDHEFDADAVSKQCGAAAILKGLDKEGEGII